MWFANVCWLKSRSEKWEVSEERNNTFFYLFHQNHSLLKLSTGLAIAALIAWKLMVIMPISKAVNPATKNIHQLIEILYAN